jgi:hypothetical protein
VAHRWRMFDPRLVRDDRPRYWSSSRENRSRDRLRAWRDLVLTAVLAMMILVTVALALMWWV